jgi:protein-S-isoprenylcysteine O-methyltransferase Ste14
VLFATAALAMLLAHWRPIPTVVWHIADPTLATVVLGISFFGWFLVLLATFLINHFELFGLHQVIFKLIGRDMPEPHFKTPVLYKVVRHPIYLGFIIAFWAAPTMTVGHLLFAAVTTAYIFVGIWLEERDLVEQFGDQYRHYRARVAMLVPFWRKMPRADRALAGALVAGAVLTLSLTYATGYAHRQQARIDGVPAPYFVSPVAAAASAEVYLNAAEEEPFKLGFTEFE